MAGCFACCFEGGFYLFGGFACWLFVYFVFSVCFLWFWLGLILVDVVALMVVWFWWLVDAFDFLFCLLVSLCLISA